MIQVGLECPKWGRNGPSALDTYLMYFLEARAVRNSYRIFEGQSNISGEAVASGTCRMTK